MKTQIISILTLLVILTTCSQSQIHSIKDWYDTSNPGISEIIQWTPLRSGAMGTTFIFKSEGSEYIYVIEYMDENEKNMATMDRWFSSRKQNGYMV
jgi:hypothetical protein